MTIETPVKQNQYFNTLQALRAIAALSVMFGHILHEVGVTNAKRGLGAFKFDHFNFPYWSGVDIFFVISGFIMVYTSANLCAKPYGWKKFLVKRFKRIVPLYWFYTTAMIVLVLLVPSLLDKARPDFMHYLTSYLFIPYDRAAGGIKPILSLGWTLNYEMFFYIVFAFLLFFSRPKLLKIISVVFIAMALSHYVWPSDLTVIKFWTSPIILEFILGAWIAHLYMGGVRIAAYWRWILSALAVFTYFGFAFIPMDILVMAPRILPAVIAVCLVVAFTLPENSTKIRVWHGLKLLGDSSYSLYLAHPFFIGGVAVLAMRFNFSAVFQMVLSVLVCVMGSYIAYKIIEKPMHRKLN